MTRYEWLREYAVPFRKKLRDLCKFYGVSLYLINPYDGCDLEIDGGDYDVVLIGESNDRACF